MTQSNHPSPPKSHTLALVVRREGANRKLLCTLSDPAEMEIIKHAIQDDISDPLSVLHQFRVQKTQQQGELENYLEDALIDPVVSTKARDYALRWLESKSAMQTYQKAESKAAEVIADLAYKIYLQDQSRTDFLISSDQASLHIRVYLVEAIAA